MLWSTQQPAPEDVLDDDDALLHHVVHLGLDQLQQHVDAAAGAVGVEAALVR